MIVVAEEVDKVRFAAMTKEANKTRHVIVAKRMPGPVN